MDKAVMVARRTALATLAVCALGLGIAACKGPQQESASAAPAPAAAPARRAEKPIEFVSADGQVLADPSAAPAEAGSQTRPDAELPLGDAGYGDYELGQRYSFLVNQLTARGVEHKLEYDASYARKSLVMPQTALGAPWELRLAFESTAEKIVTMDLAHSAADTAACEAQFKLALDKMTAVAGFAPTSAQPEHYRWAFRNGNQLALSKSCAATPYRVAFRLERAGSAGA